MTVDRTANCGNRRILEVYYREFLPYVNFITANFVTAVFQNYYYNFGNAILWAIYFVTAYTK